MRSKPPLKAWHRNLTQIHTGLTRNSLGFGSQVIADCASLPKSDVPNRSGVPLMLALSRFLVLAIIGSMLVVALVVALTTPPARAAGIALPSSGQGARPVSQRHLEQDRTTPCNDKQFFHSPGSIPWPQ